MYICVYYSVNLEIQQVVVFYLFVWTPLAMQFCSKLPTKYILFISDFQVLMVKNIRFWDVT